MEQNRSTDETAQSSSQRGSTRALFWSLLTVSLISLWVFRPVLFHGFVHWDDDIYLAELVRMG